jgi:hypothetical protein
MAGTPSTDLVQPGHRLLDQRPHQPAGPRGLSAIDLARGTSTPIPIGRAPPPRPPAPHRPDPTRSQYHNEQPEMNHLTAGQPGTHDGRPAHATPDGWLGSDSLMRSVSSCACSR